VSQVGAQGEHVTRDPVPTIRAGLQRFNGEAMPQIVQPRFGTIGLALNAGGFENLLEGVGRNGVPELAPST